MKTKRQPANCIRRAKKERFCSGQCYRKIKPGDLYLCQVMPPWHEMSFSKKWEDWSVCLQCARRCNMLRSNHHEQLAKRTAHEREIARLHEFIRQLATRLANASEVLGMLAEKKERRKA